MTPEQVSEVNARAIAMTKELDVQKVNCRAEAMCTLIHDFKLNCKAKAKANETKIK